ncbi:large ribosomal subunit protein uL10-like [Watersipora subatra]|uniref:large ribosomal subunit protein uL10-like n=1 Tax=Watersipora subatra TaxID=2589382 RepID=UPI00355C5DCB
MVKEDKTTWKSNYFMKLTSLMDEYSRIFIVNVDNVGSKQMQNIRAELRGDATLLLGKNTMMRKAIRGHLENNPSLEKLLPLIRQNVGFVFTDKELTEIRDKILANKVPAAARAGALAPVSCTVPKQVTPLGPEKTSFFQALQIPTKISRGNIEILSDVELIKANEKVGASEATLLNMLGISPFTYGLVIEKIYDDGTVLDPAILDITDEQLREAFMKGVARVASLSLSMNYPTVASAPHSIINGFKRLLAIAAVTDIEFEEAKTLKEYLADPSKFVAAASAATPAAEAEAPAPAAQEESESEDEDMGFSLFD